MTNKDEKSTDERLDHDTAQEVATILNSKDEEELEALDAENTETLVDEGTSISHEDSTDATNIENADIAKEANTDVVLDDTTTEDPTIEEEEDDDSDEVDSENPIGIPRFTKSYRIKTMKKSRNLLRGPVLYISYVKDGIHLTCILRSVSWFDHEYMDMLIGWLRSEHPLIDVKILEDADFNDPKKPSATIKLVEVPFHDTVQKAFSILNGWKWVPHITFETDEIPSEIKEMSLEIKFSYPNWRNDFDGHKQIEFLRMKGRLKQS